MSGCGWTSRVGTGTGTGGGWGLVSGSDDEADDEVAVVAAAVFDAVTVGYRIRIDERVDHSSSRRSLLGRQVTDFEFVVVRGEQRDEIVWVLGSCQHAGRRYRRSTSAPQRWRDESLVRECDGRSRSLSACRG